MLQPLTLQTKNNHFLISIDKNCIEKDNLFSLMKYINKKYFADKMSIDKIISDNDILSKEIYNLLEEGKSLNFLNNEEEDIYSDNDLKIKY